MGIEESKLKAFSLCEDVRKSKPNFLPEAAKKIIERYNLWEVEYQRLNPKKNRFDSEGRTNPNWKEIKPSIIHPFLCFHEKMGKDGKWVLPTFTNRDDAFIVSVGVVLALHDLTPGAIRITEGIWPPEFLESNYGWVFNPLFGDKNIFIEAAIKNVEADLANLEQAEIDSQYGKFGFHSKRNE
jgi:hypothetical protein